jgi:hypothetical protein
MLKNNFKYILLLVILIMISCAKRGSINGGLKDTLAPVLKISFPKNYSPNFKEKEIKLTFDEYIKLKDMNKQLIISPPMKYEPLISPTTVSKYISIKIKDTLQPNTTYSFNFGQSITDNNEGNVLNQFKYVFSTGATIDSLTLSGSVKDAYNKEVESFVSVMLYEVNDKFTDSIVYKESPRYVTNTLDSIKTFKLENLKAGKYFLVAIKDYNNNNKFNSNRDKIGFKKQYITIPTDSLQELKLFKEAPLFKAFRPIQATANRLILPCDGKATNYKIILKKGDSIIPTIVNKLPKKDSLQVWFKPLKADSLAISFTQDKYKKDFSVKLKKQKKDSLNISPTQSGDLNLKNLFSLQSTTPLLSFDKSKIKINSKDSTSIAFNTKYDEENQELFFDFKVAPSEKYTLKILPGAITDYLERQNDSLTYRFNTKSIEDYGNLNVTLLNVKHFPIILELTDDKGKTLASQYSEGDTKIVFKLLDPEKFSVRLIYDDNKNKEWDTGNYLDKRQAEEVVYLSKIIDVRANWDVEQVFDVSLPYIPESKKKATKKQVDKSRF